MLIYIKPWREKVNEFWKRVQYIMDVRKLTQRNVEDAIGAVPSQLSSWIKNDRYPRLLEGLKLADYLGVSLRWLFDGEDKNAMSPETYRLIHNEELLKIMSRIEKLNMAQVNSLKGILDAFEV
jgi:transcriptional regulator with XRE-family HTH domain